MNAKQIFAALTSRIETDTSMSPTDRTHFIKQECFNVLGLDIPEELASALSDAIESKSAANLPFEPERKFWDEQKLAVT